MKKEVLAAIVAVVVVVAAAAVLLVNNNEDDEKPLPVDTLRTDLKVGDKIERVVKTSTTFQSFEEQDTRDKFLSFYGKGTDYDELYMDGMDEVKYKNDIVECYVFKMPDKTVLLSDSYIEYKILEDDTVITLVDSNIDLHESKDKMVLKEGSYIQYSIDGKFLGMVSETPAIFTKTIKKVNDDGTYVSNTTVSGVYSDNEVRTIKEIAEDGKLTVNNGKFEIEDTKDQFLSNISFESVEKTEKNLKIVDEKNAVIDTEFGKRSVTVKTVESTNDSGITVKGKYYCGNDGIVYLIEAVVDLGGMDYSVSVTLKNSSLLTIGS